MKTVAPQLQDALASWPQWSLTLSRPPALIEQLDGGLSHSSFLLDADGRKLVLRVEDRQSRALAMAREWELQAMEAAANTELNSLAPRIFWSDEFTLVTEFIDGTPWTPLHDLPGLCATLKTLHDLPLTLPSFDLLGHCDNYWRKIQQQLSPEAQNRELFSQCRQHLQATLATYPEQCLCHNDLNPANILCHANGFSFIDWEYVCYNSPYFELATLVEFFQLSEPQSQQLSESYWSLFPRKSADHAVALKQFQLVVRFVEWLWLSLKQPQLRQSCEQRLNHLLSTHS